jgi:amidase
MRVGAAPPVDDEAFARAFLTVVCGETRAGMEEAEALLGRKATSKDFEPGTWVIGLLGKHCRAPEFARAIYLLQHIARQVGQFFHDFDVLLTPTLAMPPVATGAFQPKGIQAVVAELFARLNVETLVNAVAIDS